MRKYKVNGIRKLIILIFSLINFSYIQLVDAQKRTCQGKATFEFIYPDDKGIKTDLFSSFETKELTVYFKYGESKAEYKDMNGTIVLVDPKAKENTTLIGSSAIKMSMEEAQKNQILLFRDYFVSITKETKNIAGYKCKKAIVTYKVLGKPDHIMEIWYTKCLAASNVRYFFKGIDGFIMEYSYTHVLYPNEEGVDFREIMTCVKVEKINIQNDIFNIPSSYHITTIEELKKDMNIESH